MRSYVLAPSLIVVGLCCGMQRRKTASTGSGRHFAATSSHTSLGGTSRSTSLAGACFSRLPHQQSTVHWHQRSVTHQSTMLTGLAHCLVWVSFECRPTSLGFGRRNLMSSCSSPTRRWGGMERGALQRTVFEGRSRALPGPRYLLRRLTVCNTPAIPTTQSYTSNTRCCTIA